MLPEILISNFWLLLQGAERTLELSIATALFSSAIGLIAALLRTFGSWPFRVAVDVYVYVVRGVPLLLLLFFMYYGLPYSGIDLAPVPGGILVMSIYFGAFMSEVFRAAIEALPRAQWDAARSLGMRLPLILAIVVLPQAVRLSAPAFINTCILLIKSTSLVSIIGLSELTMVGRQIVERTFAPFQILLGVALIYFVICYSLVPTRKIRREADSLCALTTPPTHRWSSSAASASGSARPGAEGHFAQGRAERGRRGHRTERLRQDDAAALRQPARGIRGRRDHCRRRDDRLSDRGERRARASQRAGDRRGTRQDRLRLPELQPVPAHDRPAQRRGGADPGEQDAARNGRDRGPRSARARRPRRQGRRLPEPACPAASSNEWRSRGRWRCNPS